MIAKVHMKTSDFDFCPRQTVDFQNHSRTSEDYRIFPKICEPSEFVEGPKATVNSNLIQDSCTLNQLIITLASDSISPIAIFARANKATNGVLTGGLYMAVMFLANAFVHICNVSNMQTRCISGAKAVTTKGRNRYFYSSAHI